MKLPDADHLSFGGGARECKKRTAPGETLADSSSDRGSIPLVSTKRCKSEHLVFHKTLFRVCYGYRGGKLNRLSPLALSSYVDRIGLSTKEPKVTFWLFLFLSWNKKKKRRRAHSPPAFTN